MVISTKSSNFEFVPVMHSENGALAEEVKALWRKHSIISEPEMGERVAELAVIARHADGRLAGLTTVKKTQVHLLNDNYFYELRCFVDPSFRQPALDTQLVVRTKQFLEDLKSEGKPAIGLIMVVENPVLKRWTKAVWAGADFYFAGFTTKGHHLRVSYFKSAVI
jgi:hypothetical protein